MRKDTTGNGTAVIVTTFNSCKLLARVLQGYLRQTVTPDELIVADDGSTDETADVVAAFARCAPFEVRHVWQEDQGFRAARIRNLAINASESAYIIFTDGDCLPHPRFVEDHIILRRSGWFVQGKRVLVGREAGESFVPERVIESTGLILSGQLSGWIHLIRIPGLALPRNGIKGIRTCNLAVHQADLVAVNGFNEDFVGWGREDSELAARLLKYGLRRMDPLFSAIAFHLWHEINGRERLEDNDRLLQATIDSDEYMCSNGLVRNAAGCKQAN